MKDSYFRMLEDGYANVYEDERPSRLAYLSDYIFDFTTYDDAISELFAGKALEVCAAISDKSTGNFIKDQDNYRWFLLMVNMPFFARRLDWGTSIRGAWWDYADQVLDCSGLWIDGEPVTQNLTLTNEQWGLFVSAMLEFAQEPQTASGLQPERSDRIDKL